jgi:hypothetical protein
MRSEEKGRTPSLGRTGRRRERGVNRVDLFEVVDLTGFSQVKGRHDARQSKGIPGGHRRSLESS